MIEKTDIGDLKGIGEKTKKLFEKINVHTVGDLIRYYPHGYDVYEEAVPISELEEDKIQTVTAVSYTHLAWKSFGSEPKKEVTHGEENTDREETRKEQRVESSRGLPKVEKESAEEKTIVESGQAASKDMEERSGKKTEKSPESILQKTHERPEKVQPEKNSEKPEKTDKIEKKEEKTGRFEKIKCTIVKFCDKIKHTVGHAEEKLESLSEKKDKIIKELEDPVHQLSLIHI